MLLQGGTAAGEHMAIKTVSLWLCDVKSEESALFSDILRKLGEAQRAMVCEWLQLAMAGKPYGENAGKQKGREVFTGTGYSNDLLNNYARADAYPRFKAQWKTVLRGDRSSVSFAGDASFIYLGIPRVGTEQARVEKRGEDWWLVRPRIWAGNTKAIHSKNEAMEWRLDPVDNRRSGWALRHMEQAIRVSCVRIMPSREKRGKWIAKVTLELPDVVGAAEGTGRELYAGVDVGINCPAVASIPDIGFVRFLGRERDQYPRLWAKISYYEERKCRLHRAGKHRAGRDLRLNISNVRRHINECISREIIDLCRRMNVTHIRMEDLTGLTRHKSTEGRLRYWPRYHLQQRIEQKGHEAGIKVERVRAKGTSQTCSICGYRDSENRKGAQFRCLKCGFEQHADINAANNIARALKGFGPCGQASAKDDTVGPRSGGRRREPGASRGQGRRLTADRGSTQT